MAILISGQAECNVCPWKGEAGRQVDLAVWDLLLHKIGDHGCKQTGCTVQCTAHREEPQSTKVECKGPPCDCPSHPGLPRMFDEFIPSMGQFYGDDTPRANKVN